MKSKKLIDNISIDGIDLSSKQDVISDLDTIRNNAALGATALLSIPSEYVTENDMTNYAPKEYVSKAIDEINEEKADKTVIDEIQNKFNNYSKTVLLTEAAYEALETKDANTLYLIEE